MNTKMALAIGALVLVAAGASIAAQYVHTGPGTTPLEVFAPAASSTEGASPPAPPGQGGRGQVASNSSQPTITQGTPVKIVTHMTLAFDGPTFTVTTPYPTLTGSGSNVTSAQIVINDSNGVGLEAATVAIKGGRWSYSSPRALAPGTYTALLGAQGLIVKATLIVRAP